MKNRLINHIQSIQDPALRRTCESTLTHDKLFTHPASLSFHHAYEGGLLAHTVEVCDIALGIAGLNTSGKLDGAPWEQVLFPKVNRDTLVAAALWHDVMKINEYAFFWDWPANTVGQRLLRIPGTDESGLQKFWTHTDYGRLIHHISGSAMEFAVWANVNGVPQPVIDAVTHCILAHHGRKEWGSPVEPQTVEALILHQSDMMSAKYGATKDKAI